jgi:hypothetical integral membrane protein (TIGR02206 family)
MLYYFAKDWQGAPFELFGTPHMIGIALIVLVQLFLIFGWKHPCPRAKQVFRYTLAAVLVIDELLWHWWNWYIGAWSLQNTLPLHICSVMVWLSAFMLVTENYKLYEFIYFLGIGAAMQAVLTPDAGQYGFPHFRAFQVLISHGSIITTAIYLTAIEGLRPHWKSLAVVGISTNVYMLFVGGMDYLLNANYMFIAHKPETASLMDALPGWPWYIAVIELLAMGVFVILYLPFAIKDWRTARAKA